MFKLFKNERKEAGAIEPGASFELPDGRTMTFEQLIENAIKSNDDDNKEYDVDGEKLPLKELINRYRAFKKKNDDDMDNKKKNEAEEEEKKKKVAEEEIEKKKEEEEAKTNSKHFDDLKDAPKNFYNQAPQTIELSRDQLARGKARYGSSN